MDDFLFGIKTVGDFIVPLLGLFFGLCTASPTVARWAADKGAALKGASSLARWIIGAVIMLFCVAYFISVMRMHTLESIHQSPIYQKQVILKNNAEQLANLLNEQSKELESADVDIRMKAQSVYMNRICSDIQTIVSELRLQGLSTNRLDGMTCGIPIDGNQLRAIASDLNNLASHLPKLP